MLTDYELPEGYFVIHILKLNILHLDTLNNAEKLEQYLIFSLKKLNTQSNMHNRR